jgi:hypothetical protein
MEYAAPVAENGPHQLHMTKVNFNQAQDVQGYGNHIIEAHSRPNEKGSSQGLPLPSGQRRPAPVDRALRDTRPARGS